MSRLRLTLGCWNYDRTRAPQDGRVQPDGIDLAYLDMPVEETFFRMLRHRDTLATFLRYHHEQGLSKRPLEPEALFAPEALAGYRI